MTITREEITFTVYECDNCGFKEEVRENYFIHKAIPDGWTIRQVKGFKESHLQVLCRSCDDVICPNCREVVKYRVEHYNDEHKFTCKTHWINELKTGDYFILDGDTGEYTCRFHGNCGYHHTNAQYICVRNGKEGFDYSSLPTNKIIRRANKKEITEYNKEWKEQGYPGKELFEVEDK